MPPGSDRPSEAAGPGRTRRPTGSEFALDRRTPAAPERSAEALVGRLFEALIADERTEDGFTAPGNETERISYGFSLFTCLPAAMTERPTAATGTVMRAHAMRDYAAAAGFAGFERLDDPALDMLRFYRLTP